MATALLWAFIWSASWYPSWYIAAAIAMVTVSIVAGTGQLHMRGVVRSAVPVLVYFALLLLTAAWAEYPRETLKWLLVDSIEMVVFLLFFLAGRNSDGNEIVCAITTLIIPTIALALLEYQFNPFTPRLAGNALALLPLVIAFAAAGARSTRSTSRPRSGFFSDWRPLPRTGTGETFSDRRPLSP
jgi:hypothetical protein